MRALKSAGFEKPEIADYLPEPAQPDAKQEPKQSPYVGVARKAQRRLK
jgi:hypothetical protein